MAEFLSEKVIQMHRQLYEFLIMWSLYSYSELFLTWKLDYAGDTSYIIMMKRQKGEKKAFTQIFFGLYPMLSHDAQSLSPFCELCISHVPLVKSKHEEDNVA